ncbi:MAG: hypothetical protein MZW92_35535 [Comamonadaceae bacterium]|nr:hypothetical protein [Comamonadaceae bacterium]
MALAEGPGATGRPARAARQPRATPRCGASSAATKRRAGEERRRSTSTPPTLELVADDRYVNFGGVGVIVYKAVAGHGGERREDRRPLLPAASPGQVKDRPDHFAGPLRASRTTSRRRRRPVLVATDKAGNTREMRLAYELKDVQLPEEHAIALSDGFLQNKVAPLLADACRAGRARRRTSSSP